MKAPRWLTTAITTVVVASGCGLLLNSLQNRTGGVSKQVIAVRQAELILYACEAYRDDSNNPERGKRFPSTLAELVKPSFDGQRDLRLNEADLIDPWGTPYRYVVAKSATGDTELYVWTERAVDGKLKLHGAKRRADGGIEAFGLEQ